jgi:hypothetical protein
MRGFLKRALLAAAIVVGVLVPALAQSTWTLLSTACLLGRSVLDWLRLRILGWRERASV